jgi:hypothetical protein
VSLTTQSRLQNVTGISDEEARLIKAFMQGTIYSWIKNRKGEWFAVRDLMGGENFEWQGTPLYVLYLKHKNAGKDEEASIKGAAIDLGWLVKSVLAEDKRTFESDEQGQVKVYKWLGNEA